MFAFIRKRFFGKDPKMNAVEPGPRVGAASAVDVPVQPYPMGRWTLFKNPFVRRVKSVEPVAPVQGEFSLDMVKPVRNDLSDSDIEVVPAARRNEPASPIRLPESRVNPQETDPDDAPPAAWDRVKNQVFGAGKS
jgi:hypothetical protein